MGVILTVAASVVVIILFAQRANGRVELKPTATVTEGSIIAVYPHDPDAFTQGLLLDDDNYLIESTGMWNRSTLRRVNYTTGQVVEQTRLDPDLFGEGCVRWKDTYVMLTWRSKRGFIYQQQDLSLVREFTFKTVTGEGWGITHDGTHLIVSDGSSYLFFWDPETLNEVRRVNVVSEGKSMRLLNELEYINGEVYANVWFTQNVYRIDPSTGQVKGIIDCSLLVAKAGFDGSERDAVLNGIAVHGDSQRLFLTGKLWSSMFEIDMTKLD